MGAQRSITRDMPRQSLRATFEPSTIDIEKRTVELTWTTGARVLRGYWEPYFEELSLETKHVRMERLQSGAAPLLNTHGSWQISDILGVVESARLVNGKEGKAVVRFDSGPEGEDAFRRVREGTLRNVSVGYTTYKMQKIEDGATTTPVYRAIDWEPSEISLVPIGADAGAVVRSAGGVTTPCEFIQERDMPEPVATPTTTTTTATAAAPTATAPAPSPAPQPITGDGQQRAAVDTAAIVAAETTRVLEIQRLGRALKRPEAEVSDAISKRMTVEAFRAAAVDAIAAAPPEQGGVIPFDRRDPRVEPGEASRDKWMRGASNWIIERAGMRSLVQEAATKRGETVDLDPGEFRGMKLIDLARECLERDGVKTRGMLAQDLVAKAFTHRSSTGMAATGDFPILQENVIHKVLLAAWATTPDKWTRFCSRGTVSDFKPHKRYRMGSFGALSPLNEAGEFAQKSIPDGDRQSQQAGTAGNIIGITRQAIINDDLGAFSTLASGLGRAAKLSVEVKVFAELALNGGLGPVMTDGKTLFHVDHGNIGAGAALSAAALDANRVLMGSQKDLSGNELLELTPAVLLLSLALGGQARVINDSQYDPDTLANKAQMKANVAGKMFKDIVDTARITGTRRYLFADPAISPVIEVAFLDGQDMPFLEMKEGWKVDGIEWKVRLDFGVAAVDHRGAVTDAGA